MTYIELINSVLRRLREDTITTNWSGNINDNSNISGYHKLIGELVNDAKKQVEQSHDWNSLRETFNITLVDGTMQYLLGDVTTGAGLVFNTLDVRNKTTGQQLEQVNNDWLNDRMFPTSKAARGEPTKYAFNGSAQASNTREPDVKLDFYPIPDSSVDGDIVAVNVVKEQSPLKKATDVLKVPYQPVILGAWARAIAERGEDGGTQSSIVAEEAFNSLNQAIMLDAGNFEYERDWIIG